MITLFLNYLITIIRLIIETIDYYKNNYIKLLQLPIDLFDGGFDTIPLRQNEEKICKIVVAL